MWLKLCRKMNLPFLIFSVFFVLSFSFSSGTTPEAYKNYTVGDSLGWYDNLEKPKVNYQKWVAGKNFSLGDFLIFNTDSNHSVIQTYNFTIYKHCDFEDAMDNDTFQWSQTDPSSTSPQAVSMAVPLLKVGMTYFFSSDYDGEQCKNGQHFKINVTYGQGLPPSLKEPGDQEESPAPMSQQSGDDDDSAPDTLVPANFDHPKEISDDLQSSESVSLSAFFIYHGRQVHGILILVGLISVMLMS